MNKFWFWLTMYNSKWHKNLSQMWNFNANWHCQLHDIIFLFDQILKSISGMTWIQDVFNFEAFLIVLNVDGKRHSKMFMRRDWGCFNRIEEGEVKHVMDMVHRGRKSKFVDLQTVMSAGRVRSRFRNPSNWTGRLYWRTVTWPIFRSIIL